MAEEICRKCISGEKLCGNFRVCLLGSIYSNGYIALILFFYNHTFDTGEFYGQG